MQKVFSDRFVKKNWILWNQGHDGAKASAADLPDVLPSHQNRARVWFVQSSRQEADRALSRSIQAHNCHGFARFNAKAHIPQHWAALVIAKPHRTKFQFGLDIAPQRCHGLTCCNLFAAVRNFQNSADASAHPLEPRLEVNGDADGREQAEDVAVESYKPANRQSVPSYFITPVAKNQPHAENDHRNGSRAERHLKRSLPDLEFGPSAA